MDKLLGVVQNYEGKADTTMEMMLNMQKTFEEELKTLREENDEIKAHMEGRKDDSRKERTLEGFTRGEGSQEKEREKGDQSTKGTQQKTKEQKKTKKTKYQTQLVLARDPKRHKCSEGRKTSDLKRTITRQNRR